MAGLLDSARKKAIALAGLLADSYQTGSQMVAPNQADVEMRPKLAKGLLELLPGSGDAISGYEAVQSARKGNYGEAALNGIGLLPFIPSITAWHGSPHMFDKFSLDKIGTGEGAQAYGHGLYLAESPQVALEYQKKLSSTGGAKNLSSQYGGIDDGLAEAQRRVEHYKTLISDGGGGDLRRAKGMLSIAQKNLDDLIAMKAGLPENKGALYKTDIPDEAVARFLDWDKPLSQQAPEVQAALAGINDEILSGWKSQPAGSGFDLMQGVNAYDALARGRHSNPAGNIDAANKLKSAGIPGIRYLDGGSRSVGQGSSNFVAFDPELIRILERNGQSTGQAPWKPGEWKP